MANNPHIINHFDASQACYIGLLAGIFFEKSLNSNNEQVKHDLETVSQKPPALRLVN